MKKVTGYFCLQLKTRLVAAFLLLLPTLAQAQNPAIAILPLNATNQVGTQHTVTVTITDKNTGKGIPSLNVAFLAEGIPGRSPGPRIENISSTNQNGVATFSYTRNKKGQDKIVAQIIIGRRRTSQVAFKIWQNPDVPPPPPGDTTAAMCGEISVDFLQIEPQSTSSLVAINTSVSDPESGIVAVQFTRLENLEGFINSTAGFSETGFQIFDPAATPSVNIRGERIDMSKGGAVMVEAINGAGLRVSCDPVIETLSAEIPEGFSLRKNYPNPFSSTTAIPFKLPEKAHVTLTVYDALGRKVATLVDEEMSPGTYEVQWEAALDLSSGTYFYRFEAGPHTESRRMTLVK